jgi:molybdopterin-guanine dinucleotide biosynthesis protein A
MGRDKAWLTMDERPLFLGQAERLARVFDHVVIAAKDSSPFSGSGFQVIEDGVPEWAPIYGLRAALRAIGRPAFVLAVDLPRFPEALAGAIAIELVEKSLAGAVPVSDGKIQGLSAAYSDSVLPVIETQIGRGCLAIRDLVKECGGAVLDESFWGRYAGPEAFTNWNYPEDPCGSR